MSEHVRLEIQEGIARIVLDRPKKRNALTREMLTALVAAADQVSRDESVRLLQLQAEGPVFCAGMDLAEMEARATAEDSRSEWSEDTRLYREALWRLVKLKIPTLAVVQGPALAGGVGLLLACDLVLAGESASFRLPEPKRGITAAIVTPLLIYRVGVSAASRVLLTLQDVPAPEALRMGLCHEVVKPKDLDGRADEWSAEILTGSRSALAMTKQFLLHCAADHVRSQLESGTCVSASARATEDAREGLAAFLEKRSPSWVPN